MNRPFYQYLAGALTARENCKKAGNAEWLDRWESRLEQLDKLLPSGSRFDAGSVVVKGESSSRQIVIATSFHHMDEHGGYDGWTEHRLLVKPDLAFGFTVTVGGRNRNDIKDYIAEAFDSVLREEINPEELEKAA